MKRTNGNRGTNGHGRSTERVNGRVLGTNGHARHANGHSSDSLERGGLSARGEQAASDDERGDFATGSANSSATRANRGSSAGAAASPRSGKGAKKEQQFEFPGPTDSVAMLDGQAFANAMAEKIDLKEVSASLLQSSDDRIRKAELDRIRELKFGKAGGTPAASDVPAAAWDVEGIDPVTTDR